MNANTPTFSSGSSVNDIIAKSNLDDTVTRLSGGIGSGLNGLAGPDSGGVLGGLGSGLESTFSNTAHDITGALDKLSTGDLAGGLKSIAGSISSAAGMLNNVLSLKRGVNLPSGAELFAQRGTAITLSPGSANDWRVRITTQWGLFNSGMFKMLENTGGVVWPFLPKITVATKANYTQVDAVHSNYPFQAYKNSSVDEITITGEFPCETEIDAAYWIAATTFFKTATKMFFGSGANAGNPPVICNLTGYGSSIFNKVPVVIKSFSVELPDDVNYVRCNKFGTATWVPIMSTITVVVTPVYNRTRLRSFSLKDYASGKTATSSSGVGYI